MYFVFFVKMQSVNFSKPNYPINYPIIFMILFSSNLK